MKGFLSLFIIISFCIMYMLVEKVHGHGYMQLPAMRGSMWRFETDYPELANPKNYDDRSLNAGGPAVVRANYPERKYGFCGDKYSDPTPRDHESGGTYGRYPELGIRAVAKCYYPESTIDIIIRITAHHLGYFQFNLCVPGEGNNEDEDCFTNGYLLEQANGLGSKYKLSDQGPTDYAMAYKLPKNVICDGKSRCVLRWYWETGNTPGINKEEFWNCADIQISKECESQVVPRLAPSVIPVASVPTATAVSATITPTAFPVSIIPPIPSSSSIPLKTPSPASPAPAYCRCKEGHCDHGKCRNCLVRFGIKGSRKLCFRGWTKVQCDSAGPLYTWCGLHRQP